MSQKDLTPTPSDSPRKREEDALRGNKQGEGTEVPPPPAGEVRWGTFGRSKGTTRNDIAMKKAATLRKNMTDAERKLWSILRGRQFHGFKFRRQQPIGSYIADFVCMEIKLIVEVDGGQHAADKHHDIERTKFLSSIGYQVLRFWNKDVMDNIEGVAQELKTTIRAMTAPPLAPPASGGRKEAAA